MKKIFISVLMVLVGISLVSLSFANEARTIPLKSKYVEATDTVVLAQGGTVYLVTGFAGSANANYSIHDAATVATTASTNVLCEGGEATQYDSLVTLDFGDEGLPFSTGITVITSTAKLVVLYW